MTREKATHIKINQPLECCPTCGHAHPAGVGVNICGCFDCLILFGSTPREHLAPEYQERFDVLRASMKNRSSPTVGLGGSD